MDVPVGPSLPYYLSNNTRMSKREQVESALTQTSVAFSGDCTTLSTGWFTELLGPRYLGSDVIPLDL